jgi:DNA (cytosine-5)-methyltransferase 1
VKAGDLFAGLGGFTEGARRAGFEVQFAANHNEEACAYHALNHLDTPVACQDLMEFDWTQVPQLDAIFASPACQGDSSAGRPARSGTGGSHVPDGAMARERGQRDRNTAWAVVAATDTIRPRFVVIENVVNFQKRDTFLGWLGVFASMGYATHVQTLNGVHYGGAQDRPRTVVTCHLDGPAVILEPSLGVPNRTIGECLTPDDDTAHRWRPIDGLPERMKWRIAKAQREAGKRCFWANVSESRGRTLDECFPTATTQSGTQWNLLDGERCRVLNPREMANSMSFPSSYIIPTQRGLSSKLVGNAIDCNLAAGIAAQL